MKNLVLIGFMGSGKSTVGRLVAKELGMSFVDMDRWIEAQEGVSISEIFQQKGEAAFRDLETQTVERLSAKQNQVIATGGGVILRKKNIDLLSQNGVLVYLRIDAKTALTRTQASSHRPLLQDENPTQRIEKLLNERQPLYDAIPNSVQSTGRSPQEVAAAVIRIYRAHEQATS